MQLGSWFYMAPEQVDTPTSVTQSSDIYALGVTWYEMLTLDHMSPAKIASGTYGNPCEIDEINQCIRGMLNYNPADRPNAEDVLKVVRKIQSNLEAAA
jgi:serine/threonine protein kinase